MINKAMGQAEYEAFKAKLREWMETHPEEYAAFEESMNTRDMAGCQAVLLQAIALIPQYRKLAAAKANEGLFDHVDEIEQAAQDNDLARKLIGECEQPSPGRRFRQCSAGSTSERASTHG